MLVLLERSRLSAMERWREEVYRRFGLESHARGCACGAMCWETG